MKQKPTKNKAANLHADDAFFTEQYGEDGTRRLHEIAARGGSTAEMAKAMLPYYAAQLEKQFGRTKGEAR
jgi:hypothetical protein